MPTEFKIRCSECNVKIKLSNPSLIGKKVKCPGCGKPIIVRKPGPSKDDAPKPSPSPPRSEVVSDSEYDEPADADIDDFGFDDYGDDYADPYEAAAPPPRRKKKKQNKKKSTTSTSRSSAKSAISGTALKIAGAAVGGVVVLLMLVLFVRKMAENVAASSAAEDFAATKNHMKSIGLDMHNYHDVYKSFPVSPATPENADQYDAQGRPKLSWRVHILPFQDGALQMQKEFHLKEEWDSVHNQTLLTRVPKGFVRPGTTADDGSVSYQGVAGPGGMFEDGRGKKIRDITDGTSNTIMIVDSDDQNTVPWTKNVDFGYSPDAPGKGLRYVAGRTMILLADGSARPISESIAPEVLVKLYTVQGGELIGEY